MGLMGGPSCESCGRPMMSDRERGGGRADNVYCRYCTDSSGALKSYNDVLETLVTRDYMGTNGMGRAQAEVAARNAMMYMPAWKNAAR